MPRKSLARKKCSSKCNANGLKKSCKKNGCSWVKRTKKSKGHCRKKARKSRKSRKH